MSIKIKQLGLDFGSSITSVVGFAEGDDRPILFDPSESSKSSCFFTAIAKAECAEEYKYFAEAFAFGNKKDYRFSGTFKEKLEVEKELAASYLKKVFEQVRSSERRGYDFSGLELIGYGYPEYYNSEKAESYCKIMDDILLGIVEDVFGIKPAVKSVRVKKKGSPKSAEEFVISHGEPLLAAVAYKWAKERSGGGQVYNEGDLLLALDFGGHTLDMALVRIAKGGALEPIKCKSHEISVSGTGKRITGLICKRAKTKECDEGVECAKIALFSGNSTGMTSPVALKYQQGVEVSLGYDEHNHEVLIKLIRCGFQCEEKTVNLGDVYEEAALNIVKFLENSDIPNNSIKHVLFTGGTSRISYLRNIILGMIRRWLVSTRNVNQIDELRGQDSYRRGREIGLLLKASTARTYGSEVELPLTAESAVALGAALVARDGSLLKSKPRKPGESPVKRSGMSSLQIRHLDEISNSLTRVVDGMRYTDRSSADALSGSMSSAIREIESIQGKMQKFPKN